MSVDSKELKENVHPKIPKILNQAIPRRDFLKGLGAAAGFTALATASGTLLGHRPEVDSVGKKVNELTGAFENEVNDLIRKSLKKACDEWDCQQVNGKLFEDIAKEPPPEIATFFPGLSAGQLKGLLENQIHKAGNEVLANYNPDTDDGISNIKNLLTYRQILVDAAQGEKLPDIAGRYFVGLAAAESHGDPLAVSPAGAAGIIQMMKFVADKMGVKTSDSDDPNWFENDDRFKPEIIAPKGAQYLNDEYKKFGNLAYAFQSYHDGDPQMYDAIFAYVLDVYGHKLPPVISDIGDSSQEGADTDQRETERRMGEYLGVIDGTNKFNNGESVGPITMYHLLNNEKSRAVFANDGDYGDKYLYRIIASTLIIDRIAANVGTLVEASSKSQ